MRHYLDACSISDGPEFEPEPIPERDPDREYDSLRQEQDDDLVAVLSDIASIRLTDFFAHQGN